MKTVILHETYISTIFPCALEYGDNKFGREYKLIAYLIELHFSEE